MMIVAAKALTKEYNDLRAVDGGREHPGGERFLFTQLTPNRPAKLVLRTANGLGGIGLYNGTLQVSINGEAPVDWPVAPAPWRFAEEILEIPAGKISGSELEVEIRYTPSAQSPFYASYHYWILQPDRQ